MEEIPEHIARLQNTFQNESDYGEPVPSYLTDALQSHFIKYLENEIKKSGEYTELLNIILFTKNSRDYYFRNQDGEIFDVSENIRLTPKEIESLLNIPIRYNNTLPPDIITLEELKKIISKIFYLDIPPIFIENEIPLEKLKEIFLDFKHNDIIIAPLGTKKTLNTIAALKDLNQKFVFLVPTNPLMNQLADKPDIKLPKIFGNTNCDEIVQELDNNPGIITSFTGFEKINSCLKNKWEYILVFDEIHTLVWHSNYREIIRKAARNIWSYKKVIGLTGTPFGSISNIESYKYYRFEFSNKPKQKFNYQIIQHNLPEKERKIKFIDYILHYTKDVKGKVIVFYNNKEELENVRTALIKYSNKNENEIIILQSENKDPDFRKEKKFPSRFGEDIKIILTTSIIASGVNLLDDDYHSILIFDVNNFLEVFQLIGRPRENKTVINVFDFIYGLNNSKIFNYDASLFERISLFKDAEFLFNNFHINGYFKKSDREYYDKQIIKALEQINPILYWNNDRFSTDLELVYNSILENLGKFSSEYPDIRKLILEQLGIYATVEEFQEAPAIADSKAIKNEQDKIERNNLESVINLLTNSLDEVITYFISKNLIDTQIIPNLKYESIISEEFIRQYNQTLHTQRGTVNLFLLLSQICGMPKNDAAIFIRANQASENKLLQACKFISLTNSVANQNGGNSEDIFFATGIDHFVRDNGSKPITLEDFKKEINRYAGKSILAKYFSAIPKISLTGVYQFKLCSKTKVKWQKNKPSYQIIYKPFNKKIDSIIEYYKLDDQFKINDSRTRRAFNKFIKNLNKFGVHIF